MPKQYPLEARTIAGELAFSGLDAVEITKRFNDGTAGLSHPIDISYRRVREYVKEYQREHGPPPDPEVEDPTAASIAALKARITARLAVEVRHFEELAPGRLTEAHAAKLRKHYGTLDDMERRAEAAEQRKTQKQRKKRGSGSAPAGGREETELEKRARLYREGKISGPPSTTPHTTEATLGLPGSGAEQTNDEQGDDSEAA